MTTPNIGIFFKAIPHGGLPRPNEHMERRDRTINLETYKLNPNEVLLRNLYLSLDPYMRGRMRDSKIKSYNQAYEVGKVLMGGGLAVVVKSTHEGFNEGDLVYGMIGWEQYTHVPAEQLTKDVLTVMNEVKKSSDIPLSYYLGLLGMPGFTAYVGLKKIGQPKAGETIFISAAAGAVGQVVGQIAKIQGLRVVGSAGDDQKVEYLVKELGFDAAFNYKKVNLDEKLKETCPKGIDIYFENVGGETLDIVINHLNFYARIPVCGMISQYNSTEPYGVKNLVQVIWKRILLQGYIILDHYKEYHGEFLQNMVGWLREGKIKYKEDVTLGIENAPEAFLGLLTGKNFGKAIVKIGDL